MRPAEHFSAVSRTGRALLRFWTRLEFSTGQTFAFLAGFVALAGTVAVLAGVTEDVTRHNGASTTDPLHLRWFIDHRTSTVDTMARGLTAVGSPPVLALLAVVSAVALWLMGKKMVLAVAPGLALVIAATGAALGKLVVGRSRPPIALHLVNESDASFPSGHATNTTAILVTLALVLAVYVVRRPLARIIPVVAALVLSSAVGVSRLVLGVHWPTDIVAGWALGAAVALAVTLAVSVAVRIAPGDAEPATKPNPLRRVVHVMYHERRSHSLRAA
jgi:undecaprenyl-diphosphatase